MKFLKYRHKFADSLGEFEYMPLHHESDAEEHVRMLLEEYLFSDLYRGCEYFIIDEPPKEWLLVQIIDLEKEITYKQNMQKYYKNMMHDWLNEQIIDLEKKENDNKNLIEYYKTLIEK